MSEEATGTPQDEGLRNLLNRHNNDWAAMAGNLYTENHKLREKNREHRAELEALKAQVPGDDALVLTGEDRKRFEAYQELGSPDDIRKERERSEQERTQMAAEKRQVMLDKAALQDNLSAESLAKLLREERIDAQRVKDGDKEATRYVVLQGEKDEAVPLMDYIRSEYGDKVASALSNEERESATHVARQAGARDGPAPDIVGGYLKDLNAHRTPRGSEGQTQND